jgi:soluble cytochrome b562
VDAHLEARDGAGQVGVSKTITFRLPQRVFTDPLARALIEQRQALATSDNRESRRPIAEMLNALTIAPEKFYADQAGVYAAIRAAYWGVRAIKSPGDIQHVEDLLWQTAMAIEQKGMLAAANNLRELQALITAAMAAHAPQEVIDQLLQRYNQAMQRYLSALAQNQNGAKQAPQPDDPNAKTLGFDDLQKLMQAIQQLSQSGNREQAAQMLAALQNMLENMRISRQANGQGAGSQQNSELNRAIQEYGDLMGQQRALMDKTLRQQQGKGDPKDGGAQGLARQQQELHKKLDEAQQRLGSKLGKGLGKAGQQMDQAQKSLNGKDLMNARNAQENALSEMRQGADELAREMQNGKYGQDNSQQDPLGRGQVGPGPGIKLPDANDLARARDILQELRRRAGERGRPPQELDYIDRLLREF